MALISRILTTSSRGVLSSTSALPLRRTTFILRGPTPILLHTRNFSSGNDTAEQEEEAAARASFIGIPRDQKDRQVLISRPATVATQSGTGKFGRWIVSFIGAPRWRNPLMGWTSTGDAYSSLKVVFPNKEAAIEYCQNHGFDWEVEEERVCDPEPKNYGDNFKYVPPQKRSIFD